MAPGCSIFTRAGGFLGLAFAKHIPGTSQSKIVFFSTGGTFSRPPRKADLGAARLGQRGIDRGPASREPRPRPRPVARAARSKSKKSSQFRGSSLRLRGAKQAT